MDVQVNPMVSLIRERLERTSTLSRPDPSASDRVDWRLCLLVSGRLPSYHLKQLLQEAIRLIPDVEEIDNQVEVVWPRS